MRSEVAGGPNELDLNTLCELAVHTHPADNEG